MTGLSLRPHPDFASVAATAIQVYASRPGARWLRLSYLVSGNLRDLRLGQAMPSARRDGLWRTTCFEAFIQLPGGYCEYNLSPTTEWAAYRFSGYRAGMTPLSGIAAPAIDQNGGSDWYEMQATLDLGTLPVPKAASMALCAVIEAADGSKSYWALAHAAGAPDFHDPACFVARLPPA